MAAANTFLNRHPGWPAAWDQQTAPLRADLDAGGTLASSVGSAGPVRSAVAALESFRTEDSQIGVASFREHGPGKAAFTGR